MAGQTSYTEIYGTLIDSWAGSLLEPFKQVTPILDAAKFSEGKEQGGQNETGHGGSCRR